MVGGAAVDNDVRNAASSCEDRYRRGWVNGQCGAQRNNEVSFQSGLFRAMDLARVEVLAEADGSGFEVATAVAERRFAVSAKVFKV